MDRKKRIIVFILVIAVVGVAIFLSIKILDKPVTPSNNNITNTANEIITNIVSNNIIENTALDINTIENQIQITTNIGPDTTSGKDKAIKLVKDDWGEDTSVYFYVDEVNEDGKYMVSVRDNATTSVVVWYMVDVNNNTAVMQ